MQSMATRRVVWSRRARTLAFGIPALVVAISLGALEARPAHADTFTVTSKNDPGDGNCNASGCTLRDAITAANANDNTTVVDRIEFNIPGSGVQTIFPNTQLPALTEPVTIDGYTQGDATADPSDDATENTLTQPGKTNAVLLIEIRGTSISGDGGANGLAIRGGRTTVRGLVINGFSNGTTGGGTGISMQNIPGNTNNVIEGNFLGTNPGGTLDRGNAIDGVQCFGECSKSRIGGPLPAARNLASGNGRNGIFINSDQNTVQGNLVGTDKNGTNDLGNVEEGIITASSTAEDNLISENTIAFNDAPGIVVKAGQIGGFGNRISRNSIFDNGSPSGPPGSGLGIDLGDNGLTNNDKKDPDDGPNHLQNFPELASATTNANDITTIKGKLNSRPRKTFIIQFFSNPAPNFPIAFGEGKTFLGQKRVTTSKKGNVSFAFSKKLPPGESVVTATATNRATGDTSEFSNVVTASSF